MDEPTGYLDFPAESIDWGLVALAVIVVVIFGWWVWQQLVEK